MHSRHRPIRLLTLLLVAGPTPPVFGEAPEAALWEAVRSPRLDAERAVLADRLTINTGTARFLIEHGTLFPVVAGGERAAEVVFEGEARLLLDPPDDVEAAQLELFTGGYKLDETVTEAVLVVAMDAAADGIAGRPATDVDPETRRRAEETFRRWLERPERRLLGVETAIFRDALGDPFCESYFAGWFRGEELGEFLYLFEPDAREQVTLGQFKLLDADQKEKRKLTRLLHRAQRRGRLLGLSVENLGSWDTWLSTARRDAEGEERPGLQAFEPQHYSLDVSLTGSELELEGHARLRLQALSSLGRIVKLEIHSDLTVGGARAAGVELFFRQSGGEVLVVLPRAPEEGETIVLEVDYSGRVLDKGVSKNWALSNTTHWYPHTGTFDVATYDVTFHWPARLDLLASGTLVDSGSEGGDRRWERRRMEHPTLAASFEVGKFQTFTARAGHVDVTLAVDASARSVVTKSSREELLATITDALLYFEGVFGPYPLDELRVVTVARGFSQGFLGFVTLASLNVSDANLLTWLLGIEDRRTLVAHEISHQWWGHQVPWLSYRDQWISEAMANYAAMLYARHRLKDAGPILVGPTTGWQQALLSTTDDGRPIESLGPLVLGERLVSSRSTDAYQAIVYKKGAVVLEMLSRAFSEEVFLQVLRNLIRAVAFRPISTADFMTLVERITGQDLEPFARQFIYGTGLPEVYYSYDFEPAAGGKWRVTVKARQESPYRYRYRVVEEDGRLDVVRERLDQIEVGDSNLAVPVQIAVYDPSAGADKFHKQRKLDPQVAGNALLQGRLLLHGAANEMKMDVDYEPKELWLDRRQEVFGRFFNERRHPKRMLFYQGLDQAAAGDYRQAEDLFRRALAAEILSGLAYEGPVDERTLKSRGRLLDGRIRLELARLYLDTGRATEAGAALSGARKDLDGPWDEARIGLLEAYLALRGGDYERVFKLLYKPILKRGTLDSTEGLLLLAIAARETGHDAEFRAALDEARAQGADVAVLESLSSDS